MTFKVYSGPAGTDAVSPVHKDRMLFKEFRSFDEALSWASHIKETGRVAFLIEDETGWTPSKREIAAAMADRDARDVHGVTGATRLESVQMRLRRSRVSAPAVLRRRRLVPRPGLIRLDRTTDALRAFAIEASHGTRRRCVGALPTSIYRLL